MTVEEMFPQGKFHIGAVGIGGPGGPGIVGIANGGGVGFMSWVGNDTTIDTSSELRTELSKTAPSEEKVKSLFQRLKNSDLPWPLFAQLAEQIARKLPHLKTWVEGLMS